MGSHAVVPILAGDASFKRSLAPLTNYRHGFTGLPFLSLLPLALIAEPSLRNRPQAPRAQLGFDSAGLLKPRELRCFSCHWLSVIDCRRGAALNMRSCISRA